MFKDTAEIKRINIDKLISEIKQNLEKLKNTCPKFDSTVNVYHRKNAAWQRHNTKLQEVRHNLKRLINQRITN